VLKDGKPLIAMSVAGGDMQDQASLQLLLDVLEFGMKPEAAVMSPRFLTKHIQDSFNPSPDPAVRMGKIAGIEINSTDNSLIGNLEGRGHKVTGSGATLAWPVMIFTDQTSGISYAAGQPGAKTCAVIKSEK
jgi:gamma-glutamyltranspeptidase/glutathione hydrolase